MTDLSNNTPSNGSDQGNDQHFVRNEKAKRTGEPYSMKRAFKVAGVGFAYVFRHERNMRIHVVAAVFALIVGLFLGLPPAELALIVVCIMTVMGAECLNTALESVVDLVSPTYADLAKRAKDAAAAAVLVCACGSVIIACLLFIPACINFFT